MRSGRGGGRRGICGRPRRRWGPEVRARLRFYSGSRRDPDRAAWRSRRPEPAPCPSTDSGSRSGPFLNPGSLRHLPFRRPPPTAFWPKPKSDPNIATGGYEQVPEAGLRGAGPPPPWRFQSRTAPGTAPDRIRDGGFNPKAAAASSPPVPGVSRPIPLRLWKVTPPIARRASNFELRWEVAHGNVRMCWHPTSE